MKTRNGATIGYTSYNLPSVINATGGYSSSLSYGAFRNRFKQIAIGPQGTETTIYVAGLFEKVTRSSGTEYRHMIPGGQGTAAILTRYAAGGSAVFYLQRDHLGSPELITDASGNEVIRPSFGAYGERRAATDWDGPPTAAQLNILANISRRGFTGHEHLDAVGLIHMNGRVYEPVAGRFLSRDPLVDGFASSQGINGYAYAHNRPLTLVDPSGFNGEVGGFEEHHPDAGQHNLCFPVSCDAAFGGFWFSFGRAKFTFAQQGPAKLPNANEKWVASQLSGPRVMFGVDAVSNELLAFLQEDLRALAKQLELDVTAGATTLGGTTAAGLLVVEAHARSGSYAWPNLNPAVAQRILAKSLDAIRGLGYVGAGAGLVVVGYDAVTGKGWSAVIYGLSDVAVTAILFEVPLVGPAAALGWYHIGGTEGVVRSIATAYSDGLKKAEQEIIETLREFVRSVSPPLM